ncbi:hypothetical protein F7D13_16225 [Methylocystis rosea]|uniref:DUF1134 domain-containing protein n=1 Tax=Methylocystis rosea TaxID=173366 RepID=A0ABX6ELY8_9HYPH|nr:hypothetical protein [Methylocystis rosea]QGM95459.1 hypothetical protein F7D13_16225 [Methylocystis rosea]
MFNSCALPSGAVGFFLMFASAFATFGAPASAQDAPAGKPSATVTIEQIQVAFIGSGSLGGGTLEYAGKSYPITVGGLGIGGIGASKLTASGAVYGLTKLSDFPGAYVQVRRGWAIAERGRGTMWLTNGNGVTMKLSATRQGLQTALGADGVLIEFK